MSLENLEGSFNLNEIISQLYASNLVHQAYIQTFAGFIQALDRMNRAELSLLPAGTLFQIFQKSLQKRLLSLQHDNPLVTQALGQMIDKELGGLDGIHFSGD